MDQLREEHSWGEAKESYIKKKEEERKKIDEDLDSKGRWILDCGEYYWSIPDKNGQRKSLTEYEAECEANEPKMTAEEEEKRRKEREEWKKHDEQMLELDIRQMKDERNKKQRERYQRKKEELSKPIAMPKQTVKGDYEKARDQTILERYNAMKESGMFSDTELQHMIDMILWNCKSKWNKKKLFTYLGFERSEALEIGRGSAPKF